MNIRASKPFSLGVAVLVFGALGGAAQTNPGTASSVSREGQVVVPEHLTSPDASVSTGNLRPERPERPGLSPQVLARIERFKLDARKYLEQQQALKQKLQGANETQQAAIRLELQALRESWLERAREMRKEFKDRLPELRRELKSHSEVLDSARSSAKEQLQEVQQNSRTRRGDP